MTRPIHRLILSAILCAFLGAPGALNAETAVAPGLDPPVGPRRDSRRPAMG